MLKLCEARGPFGRVYGCGGRTVGGGGVELKMHKLLPILVDHRTGAQEVCLPSVCVGGLWANGCICVPMWVGMSTKDHVMPTLK